MKLSSLSRHLLGASLLTLCASGAIAAEKVTLKLAHNLDRSHVVHQAFEEMAKEVQQLSNGNMRVRIYPSSQMGSARETLELLQNGALDMTKGSASDLESFDNTYAIYNLPYLFKDQAHFNRVVFGEVGKEIMESTKEKGFFAISAYVAGTRSFYAKKPITKPEDLKGLKIRVQASPTTLKMVELMGGSPTPISFGEVYTAMQQGVVDGAENNVPSWVQTRHIEIAKVFSEDEHTSIPDFLVISTKTWNKLTPDQQQILMKAAKDSEAYQQKLWEKVDSDSRAQAKAMGATIISVDKAPFRAVVKPLYDDFAKDPKQAALLEKFEAAAQ
ncbi:MULTISPECIES: TRAP transporter substrate-binding protein [Buttiauxella]|jgi:tripartite ATP-independent transporter DctP family solute receptor|uniref:Periplasmic component of a TRAP-type C4-dicarboxylate transporter n=1 Tax=Buttiauxella gaviniae ATCC 51604 TaxID=1354253 RepID=A0A1B7HSC3_9ENTR|nr:MULTISPECIES: TRAP transporter substrate-binding protein [Buttiauxella]MRT11409.1 DctP family TRAP transporter solute-binding subunit [Enterobacteriaceae bacterium RIT711]OAT18543.1 periplasmic component of a TRAP-type C4-dicarboxylate transporter [Buttiauxella gaviniae ATCC 51604]TDX18844.1 tripartite ATP-independent transporter DctP family solute receptor [Buttiauxella sp. BIGb0552]